MEPSTIPEPAGIKSSDPEFKNYVTVNLIRKGLASSPQVKAGDNIAVHYTGKLKDANGKKFDSSVDRGDPLKFVAGEGMVIKGWDEGLLGTKVGEKRNLTIQSAWAYKDKGVGNGLIPPNATLFFECEIMSINGKGASSYSQSMSDDVEGELSPNPSPGGDR